jgi:glycosyltransferase involved in cell wall biosynthesis
MGEQLPVSVVIPAYQAEAHLARALACVAAQSRPPAEVIVVDDGSTDATSQIALRAGATVLWQANRGVAAARNAGIRAARQPWIALLDADDTWTSDRLETHWDALQSAPDVRLSFSDYSIVRPSGIGEASAFANLRHYQAARGTPRPGGAVRLERDVLQRLIVRRNFVSSSTLLLDRAWLLQHELFYAEALPEDADVLVPEDLEWLLRALRHTYALIVERVLSAYVAHDDSRSANRRRQALGVVRLGELVAEHPERYGENCAREFARLRPFHERVAAFESFRCGDYAAARADLERAAARGFDPATAAFYAATRAAQTPFGAQAVDVVRTLRRRSKRSEAVPGNAPPPVPPPVCAPVSVVIPAYDVERYLAGAIASVRAQTLPPAEIIVVDDGSTDATRFIAQTAGARVLWQKNAGVAAARNAGVAAATQPWIAFLDADDRWRPDKLALQWSAARAHPGVRFVATDISLHFESDGRVVESAHEEHPAYPNARKERLAENLVRIDRAALAESLPRGHYLQPSTWLVERDLLLREPFDTTLASLPEYHIGEDFEWALRALRESDALIVEESLTAYCVRAAGNLSASAGRARAGDVALGLHVAAAPERYLPGAAEAFERLRAEQVLLAADQFLRAGAPLGARAVLRLLPQRERGPMWYAVRFTVEAANNPAGAEVLRGMRTVKRAFAR